jgi:predicted RNase H-like HicB family nuclease
MKIRFFLLVLFDLLQYIITKGVIMELSYSWWKEDNFYLGYIDEYPQYPTQGEDLEDLEKGLVEIYNWIKDGTLKIKEQKGIIKVA